MLPRILMLCPNLPPDISGAGKQAITLGKKLKEKGYEIIYVADKKKGYQEYDEKSEFKIFRVKEYNLSGGNIHLFLFWVKLFFVLLYLRNKFDILHSHGVVYEVSVAGLIAKILRKPVIMKCTLEGELKRLSSEDRSVKLQRKFLCMADRIIAISEKLHKEFQESPLPNHIVHVIPNGVDTEIYKPIDEEQQRYSLAESLSIELRPGQPVVTFHGVIMERKSVRWLVEVLKDYLLDERLKLVIVGDPSRHESEDSYYVNLIKSIDNLGLKDKIVLRGFTSDIQKYLQISDAYILPSTGEGLSNALLEAMATGLLPIATKTSGTSQVLRDGYNGLVFESRNDSDLIRVVDQYLSIFNTEKEKQIRQNALETVESHYSIDHTAEKYSELYKELCSQ